MVGDRSAVAADDLLDHRQPNARAPGLSGKERLKNIHAGRDPGAGIGNLQHDFILGGETPDRYLSTARNRLRRVLGEVEYNLFHFVDIDDNAWQVGRKGTFHPDSLFSIARQVDFNRFAHQSSESRWLKIELLPAGERTKMLQQVDEARDLVLEAVYGKGYLAVLH